MQPSWPRPTEASSFRKYYALGEVTHAPPDFFAKCPHQLASARCRFCVPKRSTCGQLLAVRDGIDQMLEQLGLTDDERESLEGDRGALMALAERHADTTTPAGPTPKQRGTEHAFIALTDLHRKPPHAPERPSPRAHCSARSKHADDRKPTDTPFELLSRPQHHEA